MREDNFLDARIVKTRKNIINAMIVLLKEKRYEDISIKDICKLAFISRATFYTHYKDKDDLIYKYQIKVMEEGRRIILKNNLLKKENLFVHVLKIWCEYELFLLLLSKNGSVKIQEQIKSAIREMIMKNKAIFNDILPASKTESLSKYLLLFVNNGIFSIVQDWINRGRVESIEEIGEIISSIVNKIK